ncbi:MAG: response regulator [Firmicutes bacterium]|nr:two-component system response regulator [Bacillota bacterium]MBO2518749.1 two-component system response regulator [Bacillota bacterium]NMA70781.1 response regulator [Bacillota bacterium]
MPPSGAIGSASGVESCEGAFLPMRVLVVDDTAFMRLTLRRTLERFGHEVVGEAADGEEAVQLYQELRPDLVTMDITMPKMDGITAIREIRKIDPRAKIIVCSAMGQKPMVIEALEAGAQDFLVKPFDAERVREAIERLNGAV